MNEDLVATLRADLSQFRSDLQQATRIIQGYAQQTQQSMTQATRATESQSKAVEEARRVLGLASQQSKDATKATEQHTQATKAQTQATNAGKEAVTQATRAQQQQHQATDRARDALGRFVRQGDEATAATRRSTTAAQQASAVWTQLKTALAAIGITLTIRELLQLGGAAIQASTQMLALQNAFKAITGSVTTASAELGFVRQQAERLGLSFVSTAEQFKGISAAARGTTLEGQAARDIFLAVAEASRTLGLSTEQTGGALNALSQIISKGSVQSEELRGQLGERLPGSMQIAARAMGVTTAELGKMLEQGQVLATDFIPKFAAQLRKELGGGAEDASKTFAAATARMGNAINELLVAFGDIITKNPQMIQGLNATAQAIRDIAVAIKESAGPLGSFISWMGQAITGMGELAKRVAGGPIAQVEEQIRALNASIEQAGARLAEIDKGRSTIDNILFGVFGEPPTREQIVSDMQRMQEELGKLREKRIQLTREQAGLIPGSFDEPGTERQIRTGRELGELIQEKNLATARELTKEYDKQKKVIAEIEAAIAQHKAGFSPIEPERLKALNAELDSAKDKLAKMIDPEAFKAGTKAFSDAEREAKKFGTTIDRLAGPTLGELNRQIAALRERAASTTIPGELDAITDAIVKLEAQRERLSSGDLFTRAMEQQLQLQQAIAETTQVELTQVEAQIALAEASGTAHEELATKRIALQRQVVDEQIAVQQLGIQKELEAMQEHFATKEERLAFQQEREKQILLEGAAAHAEINGEIIQQANKVAEARIELHAAIRQAQIDTTAMELQQLEIQLDGVGAQGVERLKLLEKRQGLEQKLITDQTDFALDQLNKELQAYAAANMEKADLDALAAAERIRIETQAELERQRLRDRDLREAQRHFDAMTAVASDFIFTWVDGLASGTQSAKELWQDMVDSLKAMFFRALSDMAARAVVTGLMSLVFGGGAGAIGGAGGLVGTGANVLGLLGGGASTGSSLLGLFGLGSSTAAGTGAMGGSVALGAGGTGAGAGAVGGASWLSSAAVAASITAIGGAILGAGVAYGLNQLNDAIGLTGLVGGTASGALAGAGGGALAGAIIGSAVPVVGTALGAIVGTLVGAVAGGLFGAPGKDTPSANLQLRTASRPGVGFESGISQRGPFGFVGAEADFSKNINATGMAELFRNVDVSLASYLTKRQQEVTAAFLQASRNALAFDWDVDKEFEDIIGVFVKDRMETIIEGLSKPLLRSRTDIQTFVDKVFGEFPEFPSKEDLEKMEQNFAAAAQFLNTLAEIKNPSEPLTQAEKALAALNQQFDQLRQQAMAYGVGLGIVEEGRIKAIQNLFQSTIDTLEAQQKAVLQSIRGVQQGLGEALMTPAQIFVRRRDELENLQAQFMSAGAGQQVSMVPDLLRRVQELFGLAQNEAVFGQDEGQLEKLQRQLLGFLEDVEQIAGREAFNTQISAANQQIKLLDRINKVQEAQLSEMNDTLRRMEKFLARAQQPFVGSFQTGGTVPATGFALVHRGETVLPPGQSTTMNMSMVVNVQGGASAQTGEQIGQIAWQYIENQARRRMINLRIEERR